ncbi:MAG: tRNA (adenosine(37)-N6)-dimethylallyltransferase MiaA [Planctomycetes bacterium]|nr:tRNA (adenosine(37)-N6)-dimethylallyltransferase MiaA [Planctomycetota bacterium]MCB9905345.1 tRNA (adenosine(37)-N6)-dimethylallyltransferase MiaA [Planctomycetota bacterium]
MTASEHERDAEEAILDRTHFRCLVGPTASGKTELSLRLAERLGAELVSLDSMQVYRGMDVGTAKASAAERRRVPHHMLDLVDASERYDVQAFQRDLVGVLEDLEARGVTPLFVGGTAFYLKVLTEGIFDGPPVDEAVRAKLEVEYAAVGGAVLHRRLAELDPPSAERIHANDRKRLIRALEVHAQTGRGLSEWQREWGWHGVSRAPRRRTLVGLEVPRDALAERIAARIESMLDEGWCDEARAVRESCGFGPTAIQALGYPEALQLADGELTRGEFVERVSAKTRQFARKQRTWYRKFDDLAWIAPDDDRLASALDRFRAGEA